MKTIAFDIDGTLIDIERKPNHKIIDLLRWFEKRDNWKVIIWSGGGIDYAKTYRDKFDLSGKVIQKASIEVDIAVDDEEIECCNTLIKVNEYNAFNKDEKNE